MDWCFVMSGLLLCGKRTTTPYIIKEAGINIYSIEELCYYLYNNTYMVGIDFFSNELIQYISEELELPSLGQKLKYGVNHNLSLTSLVMEVLSATGYYSAQERQSIEKTLDALGSKSKAERMKARADMLFERKKYVSASNAYKEILGSREQTYEPSFVANIWNNIGVVYTKQFLFEDAVMCFKTACDIERQEEYFDNMVCAAIFSRDDSLLSDLAAQYQITDEMINQYMKAIESHKKVMVRSREFMELKDKLLYDGSRELAEYKEDIREIIGKWKDEYRDQNSQSEFITKR